MHYRSSYIATGSIKLYNYIYWITMGSRKKYKEKLRQKRRADDLFVMEILERLKNLYKNLHRLYILLFFYLILDSVYFTACCTACSAVWILSIFIRSHVISIQPNVGNTGSPFDKAILSNSPLPLFSLIAK